MADKYVKLDDIIELLEHEWGYEGMREDLQNLPTADVVEVVRCKDCVHYCITEVDGGKYCEILRYESPTDSGFCCYGERKEA